MELTLNSGRSVAALLAFWLTLAGGPAGSCAAMPDCPAMAPANDCHAAAGMKPRVETSVFCPCGVAAPSSSDSDSSATAARLALDAPLPVGEIRAFFRAMAAGRMPGSAERMPGSLDSYDVPALAAKALAAARSYGEVAPEVPAGTARERRLVLRH